MLKKATRKLFISKLKAYGPPFYIFVTCFAFLLIMFLWNEKIELDKPINHEKFNAFFTSIAAVGTTLSLYLLYKQNKQTLLANKLALAPNIRIKREYVFKLKKQVFTDGEDSERFFLLDLEEYNTEGKMFDNLLLTNYGNSVAHDVTVKSGVGNELHHNKYWASDSNNDFFKSYSSYAQTIGVREEKRFEWITFLIPLIHTQQELIKHENNAIIPFDRIFNLYLFYRDLNNVPFRKTYDVKGFFVIQYPYSAPLLWIEVEENNSKTN